ncbi:sensor histidine kinase [Stackebrandtia nassauensis]|uniref:histidine kinase n=1 Tax=Stackebrandtia nassauensis (strain DSM 44728 / CIP 108903 / NRRL B-16338 / NBRC 102104 / LLR-40K-21) TaxID=446470 RepID=D3PXH4_STANL|nr:sensor histidine kinase [Stackebrandtia nassauensis]ADD41437.1 histidine kinase [Stackebrandtia nassauensis DSM 44728]
MRNPPDDDDGPAPLFSRRLSRGQLIALDCVAAVGYVLALLPFSSRTGAPSWTVLLFAAATGLPVALRRLWPVPVFAVVLSASVTSLFFDVPRDSFVAAGFALYLVALTVRFDHRWLTSFIGVATIVFGLVLSVAGTVSAPYEAVASGLLGCVALGIAWTLGRAIRDRRAQADKAARRLAAELVSQERLHIARELHDVVAHSMSLIAVKAAVANHVAAKHPDEAHKALTVIETTAKTALTEMRRLLGVLRSESEEAAELAPAPGLSELPALARRAALAGVRVDIRADATVSDLPTGLDLSAYRIVQEAVTNVVKHAAPANCHVDVSHVDDQLRIRVTDDGPGGRVLPGDTAGHGLVGMAERVAMYGGEFDAAPRPGGGFAVSAKIPYPAEVTA